MKWFEIIVEVPAIGTEIICSLLNDMGTGGVVIDDPALILEYQKMYSREPYLFPAVGEQAGKKPVIKGYLPATDESLQAIAQFKKTVAAVALFEFNMDIQKVDDEDWANAWKEYYYPVKVGRKLVVKPPWKDYKSTPGDLVIELDPGMAFGTGTHPTTKMCLQALELYIDGGETLWDVGTGSGIIALAAAKLGAKSVTALDNDAKALQFAAENVKLNSLADRINLQRGDLLKDMQGMADIIVSNIIATAIVELAPQAAPHLPAGGLFIASGIIESRESQVRDAIRQSGFKVLERRRSGEWICYAAVKE